MTNSFQREILKYLVKTEFYKRNKQILKSNPSILPLIEPRIIDLINYKCIQFYNWN